MNFKYNGIILNKFDIGETDRLYTVYTRETGKMRLKAVGVKKPNAKLAGSLEPVTFSEIFLARGRGRGNITGAITLNNFLAIKSEIRALQKVFYVFGIFNRLITDEEKDENIFNILLGYLEAMDKLCQDDELLRLFNEDKLNIITLGFLFKLLDSLGYGIEAEKCVKCGSKLDPEGNYFNPEQGGVVCPNCVGGNGKKIGINSHAIKLIRIFLKNKVENFGKISASKGDIKNLKLVVNEEISWITG
jgi:DNA repair protein RecO (recombination protein O)